MKIVGKIFAWLFVCLGVILAVGISFTIGWRPIIGPRSRAVTSRKFEATPKRMARGEYLVQHAAMCVACHADHDFSKHDAPLIPNTLLAGIHFDEKGLPGDVYSSNITPDPETGAGSWTDDQLARAIREGIGHDGRALFPMMPYDHFRSMSDEDLASVIVYLRSVPPIRNAPPQTKLIFPVNYLIRSVPEPIEAPVPEPDRSTPEKRGKYLVNLATCSDCHTPSDDRGEALAGLDFAGGNVFEGPWGYVAAANITQDASGISYYDEKQFIQVMRTGYVGARALSPLMPWFLFRGMTDADLADIFAYIKTLKPARHHVDNSLPPTYCKICREKHGGGDQN
jgi:mono/diheme cytochrome c family protein